MRSMVIGILAVGTLTVAVASAVLILVARQSGHLLERASAAQQHLELLILLSGRISDYGLVAIDAVQQLKVDKRKLEAGRVRVDALFSAIERSISNQVATRSPGDEQTAAATKSLLNARMKAQFDALHRQIGMASEGDFPPERHAENIRNAMNAFGLHFAPQLAQAVEDQRSDARRASAEMSVLRHDAIAIAAALVLAALGASALLYVFAGRPLLSRIAETVAGATAISSGQLDRRVRPSGRDELTLLMTRFNRMADSFARREARLLDMQNDLQRVAEERTADLSSANEKLEEIDINRRQFFSDISHELRTPLTVVIGEAEVSLRQKERLSVQMTATLETILGRAKSLRRRVDDMLRVARSESGRLVLDLNRHDLNDVVRAALDDTLAFGTTHGIRFNVQLPDEPLTVSCDREWLRQAISGLLVNAIKYSPADTAVTVTGRAVQSDAEIRIRDEGRGIPPYELPQIFDRFFKGKGKSDARGGGFGIGLALVKWVVEEHGGSIDAAGPSRRSGTRERNGSSGSVFTIRIPSVL